MTLLLPAATSGSHIHSAAYDIDGRVIRSTLTGVVIRYRTRPGRGASEEVEIEIPFNELTHWTIDAVHIAQRIHVQPKPQKPINWTQRCKINELEKHGFIDVEKIRSTPKTLYIDPTKKIMSADEIRAMCMMLDMERDQYQKAQAFKASRRNATQDEIKAILSVSSKQAATTKRHNQTRQKYGNSISFGAGELPV